MRITVPSGGNVIELSVGCNNLFGCDPTPDRAELDFNQHVDGAIRAFARLPVGVMAPQGKP